MTRQSNAVDREDEISDDFKAACILAMQLALEADGAPARCPARACRKTGRCHVAAEGNMPVCQGGIPGDVAAQAALMLMFADLLADTPGAAPD